MYRVMSNWSDLWIVVPAQPHNVISVEKYLIGVSLAEEVPANIHIVTIASKVHSCAI